MKGKKRYVLFEKYPPLLPPDSEFLFQNEMGYIFRMGTKSAEGARKSATLISGSIRNLKVARPKTRKS